MKTFGFLLAVALLDVCLGAEPKPAPPSQGNEATYDGKTISEWIARTKDKDGDVRRAAVRALAKMGSDAKTAVPTFTELLKDNDENVRFYAAAALGNIGSDAKTAVAGLIKSLKDENEDVQRAAAEALGNLGPEARTAIPILTTVLNDKQGDVQQASAVALGKIGPEAKPAIPALTELLKDKNTARCGPRPPANTFVIGSQITATSRTPISSSPVKRLAMICGCSSRTYPTRQECLPRQSVNGC